MSSIDWVCRLDVLCDSTHLVGFNRNSTIVQRFHLRALDEYYVHLIQAKCREVRFLLISSEKSVLILCWHVVHASAKKFLFTN